MKLQVLRLDCVWEGSSRTLLNVINWLDNQNCEHVGMLLLQAKGIKAAQFSKLFIRRDMRRKGIASALLAQAEEIAKVEGCATMSCMVGGENHDAQDCYRKAGYFYAWNYDDGDLVMCKQL